MPVILCFVGLSICFYSCFLFASENDPYEERKIAERISRILCIHQYPQAAREAERGIRLFPKSSALRELQIRAFSLSGDEKNLLVAGRRFLDEFPEGKERESVLRLLAWGTLRKAIDSDFLFTKITALFAAGGNPDVTSVDFIKNMLSDGNALIRELALDRSLYFADDVLKEEIVRMVKEEKFFRVRQKAIEVCHRMGMRDADPFLRELLQKDTVSYPEKRMIVETLFDRKDLLSEEEVESLIESADVGLRLLGCRLLPRSSPEYRLSRSEKLLQDPCKEVRWALLFSAASGELSFVDEKSMEELFTPLLKDSDHRIALAAHWTLMPRCPEKILPKLKEFLFVEDPAVRLQASGIVAYSLPRTLSLAEESLHSHPDPFVRANMAFGLAGYREQTEAVAKELQDFLRNQPSFILNQDDPFPFVLLAPPDIRGGEGEEDPFHFGLSYQAAQLEILNLLSVLDEKRATEELAAFLQKYRSDLSLFAVKLLFDTQNDEALRIIEGFLEENESGRKLGAALFLAVFGKNTKAKKILSESYSDADRNMKQMILFALGEIGGKDTIPFLTDKMYESSRLLRIHAASALIKCLND